MKKKTFMIISFAGLVALVATAWDNAQAFLRQALDDSKSIRVVEKESCTVEDQQKPHFSGCNSIL